jgi:methionyl-tRNA formyltransferase
MPKQIVLLTGDVEFPLLTKPLLAANETLEVLHANSVAALKLAIKKCDPRSVRLLSFSSNVIVPANLLNALPGPAYNFHPGPPAYPGSHPDSFAIYEGATRFGATVHEMVAAVDAGPIVQVSEFDIPDGVDALELATLAYQHIAALFFDLAPVFATTDEVLPRIDRQWGARKWTRADYEKMRNFDEAKDFAELALRKRAFG